MSKFDALADYHIRLDGSTCESITLRELLIMMKETTGTPAKPKKPKAKPKDYVENE